MPMRSGDAVSDCAVAGGGWCARRARAIVSQQEWASRAPGNYAPNGLVLSIITAVPDIPEPVQAQQSLYSNKSLFRKQTVRLSLSLCRPASVSILTHPSVFLSILARSCCLTRGPSQPCLQQNGPIVPLPDHDGLFGSQRSADVSVHRSWKTYHLSFAPK